MLNFSLAKEITKKYYIEIIFLTLLTGILFYLIYTQSAKKETEAFEGDEMTEVTINPNNPFNLLTDKEQFYQLFIDKLKTSQIRYTNDCSQIISFLANLMDQYEHERLQPYELMGNFLFDLIIEKEHPWTNYLVIDPSLAINSKQVQNLLAYRITNRIGSTFVNMTEFLQLSMDGDYSQQKWIDTLNLILNPVIELKVYLEIKPSSELGSKYNILKYETDKIEKIALDALINGQIVIRNQSLNKELIPFNRQTMKKIIGCDMNNPYNEGLHILDRYQENFFINQRSSLFINKMKTHLHNTKSTNPAKMVSQGKDHLIVVQDLVYNTSTPQIQMAEKKEIEENPSQYTLAKNNNNNNNKPVIQPTFPTISVPSEINNLKAGKLFVKLFLSFVEKVSFNLDILLNELPESQDVHQKIEEIISHCITSYGKVLEEYGQNISGSPRLTEINNIAIFSLELYVLLYNLRDLLENNQEINLSKVLSILNVLNVIANKSKMEGYDLYDLNLVKNLQKKNIIIEGVGYDKNTALNHPVRDYVLKIFYSLVVDPSIRIQNAVQDLMTNPKFEKDPNLVFTVFYNLSFNVWHYKFYTGSLPNRLNTSHELLPRMTIYLMKNLLLNKRVELMEVPYTYFYVDLSELNNKQLAELGLERFQAENQSKRKGLPVKTNTTPIATTNNTAPMATTNNTTPSSDQILPTMVLQAGNIITPTPTLSGISTPMTTLPKMTTAPMGGTTPIFEDSEATTNPNQPTETLEEVTQTPNQSIMEDVQIPTLAPTQAPISLEEEIKKKNSLVDFLASQEDTIRQLKNQTTKPEPEYLYKSYPMDVTAKGIDGVSNIYSPEILINLRR